MQLYSVLVVDDESYVVGAVTALLQCQQHWNLEVYHAYSGQEALDILTSRRIDILLADIRMPGMTGLELVRRTHSLWSECITMMFTACDSFDMAYEAIHLGVAAFILKTESDARLLEEFGRVIDMLEERRSQKQFLPQDVIQPEELNAHLLQNMLLVRQNAKQTRQILQMMKADGGELWLLCGTVQDNIASLEWLVRDQMNNRADILASCILENKLFLLLRPHTQISSLFGALELAQEHFDECYHRDACFVMRIVRQPRDGLNRDYLRILRFLGVVCDTMTGFIHLLSDDEGSAEVNDHTVVDVIIEYIQSHLKDDLSLNTLSCLVGYNPTYLSRLFHARTGEQISRYIAKLKLHRLCVMLEDETLSFNTIAESLGFNSRSYFNRYIKRLTGYTPQQLRDAAAIGRNLEEFVMPLLNQTEDVMD